MCTPNTWYRKLNMHVIKWTWRSQYKLKTEFCFYQNWCSAAWSNDPQAYLYNMQVSRSPLSTNDRTVSVFVGTDATQVLFRLLYWTVKDSQGCCTQQNSKQEIAQGSGACRNDIKIPGGWPSDSSKYHVSQNIIHTLLYNIACLSVFTLYADYQEACSYLMVINFDLKWFKQGFHWHFHRQAKCFELNFFFPKMCIGMVKWNQADNIFFRAGQFAL